MTCYPERRKGALTGVWIAEATLPGIGRVRKRCETRGEGQRWSDLVALTGKLPNEAGEADDRGPTWGAVAEACWDAGGPKKGAWKADRDPSRKQRYDYVVKAIGADTPITEVTTATLDKLVAALSRKPASRRGGTLSVASVNRYLSCASSILTFAKARGHVQGDVEVPWQREDNVKLLWLSPEDEDAICAALAARGWHAEAFVVRVLTATGMRLGELEGLEPGQIEDDWVRLWKTKTNRPRSVPIAQPMARELRALVAANALPKRSTLQDRFAKAVESAGRNPEFSLHTLRHTCASRMVARGEHLLKVKKLLGHNSLKTTERYSHISDEDLYNSVLNVPPRAGQSSSDTSREVLPFPMKSAG